MLCKMMRNAFQGKIMTPGENDGRLLCFGKDNLLQKERVCFGTIKLLGHLSCFADLTDLHKVRGFQRQEVVPNPCRGLLHGPRKVRQRGGGSHEKLQDLHAAWVCQEFNVLKGMNSLDFFHYD